MDGLDAEFFGELVLLFGCSSGRIGWAVRIGRRPVVMRVWSVGGNCGAGDRITLIQVVVDLAEAVARVELFQLVVVKAITWLDGQV